MKTKSNLLVISAFFSGCCGLAYEILYNRILSNIFGDSFSVSFSILFTFLLGIAIGYLLAHRLKKWLFLVEICIGLYSILAVFLIIKTKSYASDRFISILPVSYFLSIIYSIIFLLTPSILIGVSIPILSKYMANQRENKPFEKAYYFYNLGAASIILFIEFIVLQNISISKTIYFTGLINIAIGIILYMVRDLYRNEKIQPLLFKITNNNRIASFIVFSLVSASYQLLLLKMCTFIFGPFRENFSLTVFTAVIFISLGTWIQSRIKLNFHSLIKISITTVLLEMLLFKISVFFLSYTLARYGHILFLFRLAKITWICFWGIPLIAFGMSVPVFLKEFKSKHIENSSGIVLFFSSLGNTLGYALMFFLIHPFLTYGTMFTVLILLLLSSLLILKDFSWKIIFNVSVLLLFCFTLWDEKILYISHRNFFHISRLVHAYANIEKIESFKAYNQTLAIIHQKNGSKSFFINGYHSIHLKNYIEKIVGISPKIVQKSIKNALVLGLGSGNTAGATSCISKDVDVVEINKAVIDNQNRFAEYNFGIHKNKHVRIILDDGVGYLKRSRKKYDCIINTVTTPLYFSSSKLYTKDFFEIIKKKLNKRGVYYTWFDGRCGNEGSFILIKSLLSSFRHIGIMSLRSSYFLLFASKTRPDFRKNNAASSLLALKNIAGSPYRPELSILTKNIDTKRTKELIEGRPVNTIDFPALEYNMANTGASPAFFKVQKWIQSVTIYDFDPITGKRYSKEELEKKYLYFSIFMPYLSWQMQNYIPLTSELLYKEESLRALNSTDKEKITAGILKAFLANLSRNKFSNNQFLLEKENFKGKELLVFYNMIAQSLYKECAEKIKPLLLTHYDNPYFHILYGICLIKNGQSYKGLKHLETALSIRPSLSRVRLYAAYYYITKTKNDEKALDLLKYFKVSAAPDYLLQRIKSVNSLLKKPLNFSENPWYAALPQINEKLDNIFLGTDFLFFDILSYFK